MSIQWWLNKKKIKLIASEFRNVKFFFCNDHNVIVIVIDIVNIRVNDCSFFRVAPGSASSWTRRRARTTAPCRASSTLAVGPSTASSSAWTSWSWTSEAERCGSWSGRRRWRVSFFFRFSDWEKLSKWGTRFSRIWRPEERRPESGQRQRPPQMIRV